MSQIFRTGGLTPQHVHWNRPQFFMMIPCAVGLSPLIKFGQQWNLERTVKNLILQFNGLVQRSVTDFFGPLAGSTEIQNPEWSSAGPVDSV